MSNNKKIVKSGMDAFFKDFDDGKMRKFFKEDYIQHNPFVATGLEPALAILPKLKEVNFGYTMHRCLGDGDLVLTHSTFHNADMFGTSEIIACDLWRIENGKIAEHWDAIQSKVENTASGRSQVDGVTAISDLDKTEQNRQLIKSFSYEVFTKGNTDVLFQFISTESYHQHNPMIEDGLEGLGKAFGAMAAENNMFILNKTHRVLAEGNFVVLHSEGEWGGKPQSFFDIFRIADGKLVEHWDVIQEVPAQMPHDNGMF